MAPEATIEVTGWNAEGESVYASGLARDGESPEDCLQRLITEDGIVEIGDVRGV